MHRNDVICGVLCDVLVLMFQKNLEVLRRSKMSEAELEELERKESEVLELNYLDFKVPLQ